MDCGPASESCLKDHRFPGNDRELTPVVNALGAVELMLLLPGKMAYKFRRSTGRNIVQLLNGDPCLIRRLADAPATGTGLRKECVQSFCSSTVGEAAALYPDPGQIKYCTEAPKDNRVKEFHGTRPRAKKRRLEMQQQRVELDRGLEEVMKNDVATNKRFKEARQQNEFLQDVVNGILQYFNKQKGKRRCMSEVGFEPTPSLSGGPDLKSGALDHSATLTLCKRT
jgi:hypothetical protein